jgi:hypothetical protein
MVCGLGVSKYFKSADVTVAASPTARQHGSFLIGSTQLGLRLAD